MRTFGVGAVSVVMGALVLAGCTPSEPEETTAPPTVEPTVDALETARQRYVEYLNAGLAMLENGTADPTLLDGIATPEQIALNTADVEATLAQGYRAEGVYDVSAFQVHSESEERLEALVCIDNSQVNIIRSGETQPASPADPVRVTFELTPEPLVTYIDAVPEAVTFRC